MKAHAKNHQAGFTLIEYIVTLVIAAIMASMVYTYFGTALTKSSEPIFRLQKASNLHQVMENIVADYNRLNKINLRYKWRSGQKYSIGDVVLPSNNPDNNISEISNNARYYICTAATGTRISGSALPLWHTDTTTNTALNRIVTDGPLEWTEKGYVWNAGTQYPASAIVVPAINNGHFYKGPSSNFTSGATDPNNTIGKWPTTASSQVSDGTVTWTEAGTILSSSNNDAGTLDNLYTLLPAKNVANTTNTRYGTGYEVTAKDFIGFDNSNPRQETAATELNIIKVTIKNNDSSETLTELFTIR